jgi:hypothetical protein
MQSQTFDNSLLSKMTDVQARHYKESQSSSFRPPKGLIFGEEKSMYNPSGLDKRYINLNVIRFDNPSFEIDDVGIIVSVGNYEIYPHDIKYPIRVQIGENNFANTNHNQIHHEAYRIMFGTDVIKFKNKELLKLNLGDKYNVKGKIKSGAYSINEGSLYLDIDNDYF